MGVRAYDLAIAQPLAQSRCISAFRTTAGGKDSGGRCGVGGNYHEHRLLVLTFDLSLFISTLLTLKFVLTIVFRSFFGLLLRFGIPYESQPTRDRERSLFAATDKRFTRLAGPIPPSRDDGGISVRVTSISERFGNSVQLHSLRGLWRASPHGTTGFSVTACLCILIYGRHPKPLSGPRIFLGESSRAVRPRDPPMRSTRTRTRLSTAKAHARLYEAR